MKRLKKQKTYFKDFVSFAAAARYDPNELQKLGLRLDVNTLSNKVRFVGNPSNPIYPEIIIWKPDFLGATNGKVVLVESIEMTSTLNANPLPKWQFLASLGVIFNIIVPENEVTRVKSMIGTVQVRNLLKYVYNQQAKRYEIVGKFKPTSFTDHLKPKNLTGGENEKEKV
jgi:hypothetical protein